ncbi:hypothetical protein [Legionella worsleiensis]|uniref:Uncharacterized protein n=1 Tax=Legionella worsleiensis TaxID=45076 RepID=A0A0W1AJF4_9GAMM|nr:hypothetical protein [Legionella worsleiensis]KTD81511.1 hypothetical protein Lwor_0549 [Legionella worsleiensis]STY32070.1 Uncharacterised protein [Legionella worsleiensis]
MDSARDISTGKIIEAEQLWLLSPINANNYICRGCNAIVTPCSYHPQNKKRPYFSAKQGHKIDCDVDGEIELVKRARKERITTQDGFPGNFPRKLVLHDKRPVVAAICKGSSHISESQSIQFKLINTENNDHCRTVSTIRQICRVFINFPFDRDLPLTVPGISSNTYQYVFWSLKRNQIILYPQLKIFYAPISWKALVVDSDHLDIQLNAGEWGEKGFSCSYKVRINWKDWGTAKRNYVTKEIEIARLEAIEADKRGDKQKGWLFFIGKQDSIDPSIFHVEDHRLICCLVAEMLYPK